MLASWRQRGIAPGRTAQAFMPASPACTCFQRRSRNTHQATLHAAGGRWRGRPAREAPPVRGPRAHCPEAKQSVSVNCELEKHEMTAERPGREGGPCSVQRSRRSEAEVWCGQGPLGNGCLDQPDVPTWVTVLRTLTAVYEEFPLTFEAHKIPLSAVGTGIGTPRTVSAVNEGERNRREYQPHELQSLEAAAGAAS